MTSSAAAEFLVGKVRQGKVGRVYPIHHKGPGGGSCDSSPVGSNDELEFIGAGDYSTR